MPTRFPTSPGLQVQVIRPLAVSPEPANEANEPEINILGPSAREGGREGRKEKNLEVEMKKRQAEGRVL